MGLGNGTGGFNIGSARVYSFSLRRLCIYLVLLQLFGILRLFDVQTTTQITLNTAINIPTDTNQLPASSFVKGKSSGASGYVVGTVSNSTRIDLNQTTGTFAKGEQIEVNGVDFPRTIGISTANTTQSIKSVKSTGY